MANQKEIGIFGLPRSLSKDPRERRAEIWQSINVGYDRVNRRFGKVAAHKWQPNSSTVILYDTTSEFDTSMDLTPAHPRAADWLKLQLYNDRVLVDKIKA